MAQYRIPTTGVPETLTVTLAGTERQITLRWNDAAEAGWVLDIAEPDGGDFIVVGIPLVTGTNLLLPYASLGLGGSLVVWADSNDVAPGENDLGNGVELYFLVSDEEATQ